MAPFKNSLIWVICIVLMSLGCNAETQEVQSFTTALSDHIKDLQNVSVYSLEKQLANTDTVELIRETVFESNEDVFMAGYLGEVAVDDQDRVYIVSSIPGTVHVYVFEPDGTFITKFMREGRGPGEAESIGSMKIRNDKIYVFGPRLQKYLVYSTEDFSFEKDAVIKRDSIKNQKFSTLRAKDLFVDDNGQLLLSFQNFSLSDSIKQRYYHRISENGQILPETIFSQEKLYMHTHKVGMQNGPPIDFPMAMPFTRSSLFHISEKIYDLWTEDFLIKIHDLNGEYQRSIYYPFQKAEFDLETTGLPEDRLETAKNDKIPNTWPAVHDFLVDDESRIWVAAITDSDSAYQWYVLDNDGELKAEFTFPGKRAERSPMLSRQLPAIRNGYFYTRERNLSEGIDRIVKYRIEIRAKEIDK